MFYAMGDHPSGPHSNVTYTDCTVIVITLHKILSRLYEQPNVCLYCPFYLKGKINALKPWSLKFTEAVVIQWCMP